MTSGPEQGGKYLYQEVPLKNGSFAAELKYPATRVKAFYIPSPGFGDSESDEVKVG